MHAWIWPALIAVSQGVTAYGITFVNKLMQLVAHTLEAHVELSLRREEQQVTATDQ
ncbi:hypothetical protein NZD89_07830 [Alicyclobacillus fastidiosus]|uniref:Uncharacterized protein n=1 Tax=Alicyclobacillus fastidiosus TaxID=392011 RepID=A0ABY6ZL27_9BACL|nr:hypothetical protein [Alicyclobacillus fastidiosus]WAH43293.1 hypothetical protein NZD89_07830 [Alicyclobacillus fastidiosus]GMA65345.1 hypothetical protein GCM10025859_57850 [Alicyclobacillus fastidiosus]